MSFAYSLLYFICSFVILSAVGMIAMWVDRKVTARIQWRVGPPWWQNFADFVKLTGKEVLIPESANKFIFIIAPVLGLLAVVVCGGMLFGTFAKNPGFSGDLIVFIYLLTIPSLAIILGASSSGNVLSSVGESREIKLLLGYELPFICAVIVPVIKAGSVISLQGILKYQHSTGLIISSFSGIIAFFIALFAIQGKLGFVPFDAAEAEGEIGGGALIEYSGILLGFFKLTKAILFVVAPLFLVTLYLGGISFSSVLGFLGGILKYVIILVLMILMKNTNPRLRIDQIMKFFWGKLTLFGIIGIILAFMGW